MAAGISIGVAADTRPFSMGVKNGVVQPLEDVEKALDKVDDASDKAGDALVSDMKSAQKSTEKLADEYKDLGDVIKRESREAGRNIDKNIKDGTDGAKEGLKEFKDEANSTARESAASFDGSFESVIDSVQEISANALGGFGPLGAVAGLALAAGIGAGFTQMQEDAEETKEKISEMFEDMAESGKSYASEDFINDSLKELVQDTDKLKGIQADANSLGLELSTTLRAQAGDQEALNEVNQAAIEKLDGVNERKANLSKIGAPIPGELQAEAVAAEDLLNKYSTMAGNLSTAAGQAAVFRDAQAGVSGSTAIAKGKVDEYNNAVAAIQSQKSLDITVNTAAAEAALAQLARNRTVQINVNGDITRIGNQVW